MNIQLRPWNDDDLQVLVRLANEPDIAINLTNHFPYPYGPDDGRKFIEMTKKIEPRNIMAITLDKIPIGAIGVHPQSDIYCKNCELGYWLGKEYWGKGIMTKAVTMMIEYGFDNFDITRIFARPFGRNVASQKVLEKCGFKLEARMKNTIYKNGVFEDEMIYAIRRE
jgi:RimJ/RimL family protein N-acetyltransferase